jgi:hypothetical protein
VLIEREVSVDDADLVAVALGDGGEDRGVEPRAEGALEVVEVDDDDGCGGRSGGRPPPRRRAEAETSVRGSAEMSYLMNCATVLPSAETRKSTGFEVLPSLVKVTVTVL